jgi:hypothetical protein
MKKLLASLFAISLIFMSSNMFAVTANAKQVTAAPQAKSIPLTFIQTANMAKLTQDKNQPSLYILTLYGVSPYITYLGDRPNRTTGVALMTNFLKAWKVGAMSFEKTNPNAVVTAAEINQQLNSGSAFYTVQLSHPRYSLKDNAVQYTVKNLSKQAFVFKEMQLAHVTLVIN